MLVSTTSLAELAERLELGDHMILGRGEEKTGGRRKQALLADTCEALIAAIYLDGGLEPRAPVHHARARARGSRRRGSPDYFGRDHKSRLQEGLQASAARCRSIACAGEVGPEHRKLFTVEVVVGGEMLAAGRGAQTKKDAEQEAARAGDGRPGRLEPCLRTETK